MRFSARTGLAGHGIVHGEERRIIGTGSVNSDSPKQTFPVAHGSQTTDTGNGCASGRVAGWLAQGRVAGCVAGITAS
jgi:hypothetical protein